ncbi:MAG: LysM peptidoglycan-binding domain-containing protein [Roseburia sp.]
MDCERSIEHVVQQGDTLYKLSRQYKTTVASIIMDNARVNPYNLQIGMRLKICPGPSYQWPGENVNRQETEDAMRLAWLDHVYWTRMFIMSVAGDLPDQKEIAEQMIKQVERIGQIFAAYYPQSVVRTLTDLLMDHVELAGSLITALKMGEQATAAKQRQDWYQNGDAITALLANETPEYNHDTLTEMWNRHLQLTEQEAKQRLAGEYAQDVETFNQIEAEIIKWADYLSRGLQQESEKSGI